MKLTDEEFNRVFELKKFFDGDICLPKQNERKFYTLKSIDGFEHFELNIERKTRIELKKIKLHHSYFKEPIVRLEVDAPPHKNPDGKRVGRNHIHIYREGYGLTWAYELDEFSDTLFRKKDDFISIFNDFCVYCNIENNLNLQGVF
jgi:hypothetical protein